MAYIAGGLARIAALAVCISSVAAGAGGARGEEIRLFEATIGAQAKPPVMRVTQGDKIEIRWSSTKPLRVHLHGYDLEARTDSAGLAVFSFTAKASGRFPFTTHGQDFRHKTVGYLEVLPR